MTRHLLFPAWLPYTAIVAGISPLRLHREAASCPNRMLPRRSGTRRLPRKQPSPSSSTRRSSPPRRVIDRLASSASSRSRTSISSSTARSSARCRQGVEASLRGGSRVARAIKALFLGALAAGIGAVIYYAIIRMTGLNIGLIAVVVGVMVGGAVRRGSGNRGGPFYQGIAILLTYLSIVAMNVPLHPRRRLQSGSPGKSGQECGRFGERGWSPGADPGPARGRCDAETSSGCRGADSSNPG